MRCFALLVCFLGFGTVPVSGADLTGTVAVADRPAQDAVVWLAASNAPAGPPQKVVLDQRNLAFIPHVLAVRVGTTVDFPMDR